MTFPSPFRSALLTSTLACALAIAAGPAGAASHSASRNLTPYKFVSTEGLCLTAGEPGPIAAPVRPLRMERCSSASQQQTFYVLAATADTEAVPQLGTQVVRIALVDAFDRVLDPAYHLIRALDGGTAGTAGLSTDDLVAAPGDAQLLLAPAGSRGVTWVHVGDGGQPEEHFAVTGKRGFRFGPALDGSSAQKTVLGLEVAGTDTCSAASFRYSRPVQNPACAVRDDRPVGTPMQIKVRGGPQKNLCLSRSGVAVGAAVDMRACNPGSSAGPEVWMLQPAPYLY